ncbi:MAG: VanZ family protein [Oscillospiraceae bacterium]
MGLGIYLNNIVTAVIVFPLLAAIITIPYVIHQYRKYGAMLFLRVALIYSFILYMLCAYFMIILPLPKLNSVSAAIPYSQAAQLMPFHFVESFLRESGFVAGDSSTYLSALKSSSCITVLFNILLVVPFGIYMRYYFKKSWKQTLALSFLLSLFYELTQLSGLYFIYQRAYRLFDVDDLMMNTLGGMIGFWITPLVALILPTREKLDELSYRKGRKVTITRRVVAAVADWIIIVSVQIIIAAATGLPFDFLSIMVLSDARSVLAYAVSIITYFMILPWLLRGRTPGKMLVKIRIRSDSGKTPRLYQYILRYGMLYFLAVPSPFVLLKLLAVFGDFEGYARYVGFALILASASVFVTFVVRILIAGFSKNPTLAYGRISRTENVSVVDSPKPPESGVHREQKIAN